ncbi:hypothetical protein CspeluHIS016_0109550 [Cutaneotrichosporon spelunceum]|uniref:DUF3224 domain-containing protein n=1 Tax=Cutaneotrichosporon spelunceum TaxID=1672016 RepID=A0AAD3YA53_9TREE|nr:hypothetical protein CspeluHIS016_0109550 [Cutaneotrichosporon spelunceum]
MSSSLDWASSPSSFSTSRAPRNGQKVTAPFTPSGADYAPSKRFAALPSSFEGASTGVVETGRQFAGGGMEGWASVTYIILHSQTDPTRTTFAGFMNFAGSVLGKQGGFAAHDEGTCQPDGTIDARWRIVDGSGTGALVGIAGAGAYQVLKANQPGEESVSHAEMIIDLPSDQRAA